MLNRLHRKITEFINSEEGKVGVKTSFITRFSKWRFTANAINVSYIC